MSLRERIEQVWPAICRGSDARQFGIAPAIGRNHVRIHHGWYVDHEIWSTWNANDQHLARILAVHRSARTPPVFSYISAAELHGFSLHEPPIGPVHISTGVGGGGRPSYGIRRCQASLSELEIFEKHGLRFTTPERTILDLARGATAETALICADHHLRKEFRVDRIFDTHGAGEWKQAVQRMADEAPGKRGVRAVRRVLDLADPRKDSALESLSHLQLTRLGFDVTLQVELPSPHERSYYLDFELLGHEVFGECDGKFKYTDSALLGERTPAEQVYREKRRDDWITGITGKRVIHWGYADVQTPAALARRLTAFGLRIPRAAWRLPR